MRQRSRRRRALVLLALALATGALAAAQVRSSVQEVESRVGSPLPVVVARADIRAGARLEPGAVERMLAVREVPELFAPPDALSSPHAALGQRAAVPIAAGSYVTTGDLETGIERGAGAPVLAPGERVVEIVVAGGEQLAGATAGARVDVLITTGEDAGTGRTYVALEGVELVEVRPVGRGFGAVEAPTAGTTVASLRVTLEQAVLLTAAQNFAREIRLLARSPEDRKDIGRTSVHAGEL